MPINGRIFKRNNWIKLIVLSCIWQPQAFRLVVEQTVSFLFFSLQTFSLVSGRKNGSLFFSCKILFILLYSPLYHVGSFAFGRAYTANVKKVDNGISHVVKLLDDFYDSDGRTAYVFVSDHGMTDRGMANVM